MVRMLLALVAVVVSSTAQETKIDSQVSRAIRGGRSAGVILLGKRQLFEGPKGFPNFCVQNKAAKRTELRLPRCDSEPATEGATRLRALE